MEEDRLTSTPTDEYVSYLQACHLCSNPQLEVGPGHRNPDSVTTVAVTVTVTAAIGDERLNDDAGGMQRIVKNKPRLTQSPARPRQCQWPGTRRDSLPA